MVKICGAKNVTRLTHEGALANECFLDVLSVVSHVLFFICAIPILIALTKLQVNVDHAKSWVHFPGHCARYIISLLLILLNLLETSEGLLSDANLVRSTRAYLYFPHVLSLVGSSLTIIFYHHIETGWNSPRFLLLLMLYWTSGTVLEIMKFLDLLSDGVDFDVARFCFTLAAVALYAMLLILELWVWTRLKYALFTKARVLHPPDFMVLINFIYDYVSLYSKATFCWVRRTLHAGYHRTLSLKSLGHLAPEPESIFVTADTFVDCPENTTLLGFWFIAKTRTRRLLQSMALKLVADILELLIPIMLWFIIDFARLNRNEIVPLVPEQQPEGNATLVALSQTSSKGQEVWANYVRVNDVFSNGYVLGMFVTLVLLLRSCCLHNAFHLVLNHSLHVRAAIQMGLCDKMTRLSVNYRQEPLTSCLVSTLVADSCATIPRMLQVSLEMWATPLRLLLCVLFLHCMIGPVALLALALVALFSGGLLLPGYCYNMLDVRKQLLTDIYLRKCQEFLEKIKFLKVYCWEGLFAARIVEKKKEEVMASVRGALLAAAMKTFAIGSSGLITVIVLSLHYKGDVGEFESRHIFVSLIIIEMMCQTVYLFPFLVSVVRVGCNSLCSIHRFLDSTEVHGISIENKGRERRESSLTSQPQFYLETNLQASPIGELSMEELAAVSGSMEGLQAIPEENHVSSNKKKRSPKVEMKPLHPVELAPDPHLSTPEEHSHKRSNSLPDFQDCENETVQRSVSPVSRKKKRRATHAHGPEFLHSVREGLLARRAGNRHNRLMDMKSKHKSFGYGPDDIEMDLMPQIKPKRPNSIGVPEGSFANSLHSESRGSFVSMTNSERYYTTPAPQKPRHRIHDKGVLVRIKKASFAWEENSGKFDLSSVDLTIESGRMYVVQGPPGCGRSTLIAGMLGELTPLEGEVLWKEGVSTALVCQRPWIMSTSVRENILFGSTLNQKRYQRVLHACALNADIGLLPAGDMTQIGDQGLTLSIGQRQRICIARALYSHADLIILDDPFQTLGDTVIDHILTMGFRDFVLSHHRSIMVTCDSLNIFLPLANQVICLEDRTIAIQGTVEEVAQKRPVLFQSAVSKDVELCSGKTKIILQRTDSQTSSERQQLIHQVATLEFQHQATEEVTAPQLVSVLSPTPHLAYTQRHLLQFPLNTKATFGCTCIGRHVILTNSDGTPMSSPGVAAKGGFHVTAEDATLTSDLNSEDELSGDVLMCGYIQACSRSLFTLMLVLIVCRTICAVSTDGWLLKMLDKRSNATEKMEVPTGTLAGYTVIGGLTFVALFLSLIAVELVTLRASLQLCKHMLENIAKAALRFFDSSHTDAMLRRFSEDVSSLHQFMPAAFEGACRSTLICLAAVLVNVTVTPYFFIPGLLAAKAMGFLHVYFKKGYRYLRVVDESSQPCIAFTMSRSLVGLATIRAMRRELQFMAMMRRLVERAMLTSLWVEAADRWLHIRLDLVGALVMFSSVITSVTFCVRGEISVSMMGLAVLYGYWMSSQIVQLMRWVVELEMYSMSLNRCLRYTEVSPEEKQDLVEEIPPDWPKSGKLEFRDVSLRYDVTFEPIVRHVNFHIKSGWKVGVCGQLGSGKSTLALGLLRMVRINRGHILLGDLDVRQVPLEQLRSKVTVISQQPVLCQGTLRFNLDPSGTKTDEELWTALEVVHVKDSVEKLKEGLDSFLPIPTEDFFTPEDLQLFSLAQAYLRDTAVLVLDEPVAIVSQETKHLIQEIIKTSFKNKTVMFLAAHLVNPLFYDRVIIMQDGEVITVDRPQALTMNPIYSQFFVLPRKTF